MPQSGEALGVTSLGSRSRSHNLPCNSTPHPKKPRALRPALKTQFLKAQDNGGGGGETEEGREEGKEGRNFIGKRLGFSFFIIIFHLLVHQLKS